MMYEEIESIKICVPAANKCVICDIPFPEPEQEAFCYKCILELATIDEPK